MLLSRFRRVAVSIPALELCVLLLLIFASGLPG